MTDNFAKFDKLHICVIKSRSGLFAHTFTCTCWSDCFNEVRKYFAEDIDFRLLDYYDLFEVGTITESGIICYDEPEILYGGIELRKKILQEYAYYYFDEFVQED